MKKNIQSDKCVFVGVVDEVRVFLALYVDDGLVISLCLRKNVSNEKYDSVPYRELIGSLMFAARVSRPDIEYSVNYMSQFFESYGREHWNAAKIRLRYLMATQNFGIIYGCSGSQRDLVGYTDADFAGCIDTRKT
ncbi:uncharacterized protein LOC143263716 [Megalopta genalis]|uniref:uncharacterized protein LOC143263716 n=1 Tax=Megalopta genalis TaxID=115081 RepID=UPI003FD38369